MSPRELERRRKAQREWYARNRKTERAKRKARAEEIRKAVRELKSSTPCADCKRKYPHYVMDFDHVRGKKAHNISALMRNSPTPRVWVEIAKCEVVCSNCHRARTYHQAVARQKKQAAKRLRGRRKKR
jgi:hypothetical protein